MLQAFKFNADKELLREPRIVRVGLIQNSIALPTTAPFLDQKKAIFQKLKPIIDATGASGVNILCLQWCEFAEPADGEWAQFLQGLQGNITCYGRHHLLNWLAFGLTVRKLSLIRLPLLVNSVSQCGPSRS
ncbi:putative beta-ureidopropionase [Helianthus annuus]|nr:putative beta-ureidopropionase [Helianthus annuus]KAJ0575026.1 putative beta-ureidopropionase [Helianthus annuus]